MRTGRSRLQRAEVRAGAAAMVPLMVGAIPVALLIGAAPVAAGFGGEVAIGSSVLVFGGTSQLALIDVLSGGGGATVAIAAALIVNLRYVLYSASIAPYLAGETLRRRIAGAYVMTDQSYAVSLIRWRSRDATTGNYSFYLGGSLLMWTGWQIGTVAGVVIGPAIPDGIPLDFAVPLMFLVLLLNGIDGRSTVVSALVGGSAAVLAAEAGLDDVSILVGSLVGIAAGTVVAHRAEGRTS